MLAVVVEFHVHRAHVADFFTAIVANAKRSLSDEPACRQFDVCRDPLDPTLFFLYELYDDDAGFEAHLKAPHFLQMSAETATWVAAKTVRRLQRIEPLSP
jgi:(4S)-4-hydroxy-5-phosphonooxypentane-2,3-dione isomerase